MRTPVAGGGYGDAGEHNGQVACCVARVARMARLGLSRRAPSDRLAKCNIQGRENVAIVSRAKARRLSFGESCKLSTPTGQWQRRESCLGRQQAHEHGGHYAGC
jgi:hypothetical protein